MANVKMVGAILLLIGGLVHGIPQLYEWLSFGGVPWVQVLVGWVSVIVALLMLLRK